MTASPRLQPDSHGKNNRLPRVTPVSRVFRAKLGLTQYETAILRCPAEDSFQFTLPHLASQFPAVAPPPAPASTLQQEPLQSPYSGLPEEKPKIAKDFS